MREGVARVRVLLRFWSRLVRSVCTRVVESGIPHPYARPPRPCAARAGACHLHVSLQPPAALGGGPDAGGSGTRRQPLSWVLLAPSCWRRCIWRRAMPFIEEARCGYCWFCRQLVVRLAKDLAEMHLVPRPAACPVGADTQTGRSIRGYFVTERGPMGSAARARRRLTWYSP